MSLQERRGELYLPEKYPVIIGEGDHVGFCTVWSDPEKVLERATGLRQKAALIGTLYSREGVNIILRNLCLNPAITKLLIWGKGDLSQTTYGVAGMKIIRSLWENGVDDTGTVIGAGFKVHPEIDLEILKQVVDSVSLIDVSHLEIEEAVKMIDRLPISPQYMEGVAFEEHKREGGEVFPSEEVGFVVRGKKVVDAWLLVVDRISQYGLIKSTEYGNLQRELPVVTWVIEQEDIKSPFFPNWPEELLDIVGLRKGALEEYYDEFLSSDLPEETAYTYGNRLRAFPSENGPVDQINDIIRHIRECPVTRRAVATTLYPPIDKDASSPPCIDLVQALLVNDKLCLIVTVRSHDIFKGGIPNAFGLLALQEHISKETGYPSGKLVITSHSAHIYEEDWENVRKLLQCEIWERQPRLEFDPLVEQDPRGNVILRAMGDVIELELLDFKGNSLFEINGVSALEVGRKLAQLNILSHPYHWLHIGQELEKAEMAMRLNLTYEQDRPLSF